MQTTRPAIVVGTLLLAVAAAASCAHPAPTTADSASPRTVTRTLGTAAPPAADFTDVSRLIDDAVAARRLPGAVVVIGHAGRVVFHQAYGSRKLDDEPGLDGSPAPAEPMTEDTIFDMASLTKPLATATAIMKLYEHGKVRFDDPVQDYLPAFNSANDPRRAEVTVRMLLTHTSGETGDVNLGDPWGLDGSDRAQGILRALTTPLESSPGGGFRYSDINYIVLGVLIEKLTDETEDVFVRDNVFAPLGMADTRYLPPVDLVPRIAPTAHDEKGQLLRGTVHDTTARRMGGVAGHAGLFSTAHDVSSYAQALLDRLAGRPSTFPLTQSTLELMTTPQQPGHTAEQVDAANEASREAMAKTPNPTDPLLAPKYPAIDRKSVV